MLALIATAVILPWFAPSFAHDSNALTIPAQGRQERQTREVDWRRRSIPALKMSLEIPFEPDDASLAVNEQAKKQISDIQSARIVTPEGIVVRLAYVKYVDGTKVDLKNAADGALASIQRTMRVTELKPKYKDVKVSGTSAILVEASYQYSGSPVSYLLLVAGDGPRLWQVTAMYKTALAEQEAIARRIVDSVRLER
jgi:hypothetical protein